MQFSHAITRRPGVDMADGITTSTLGLPEFDKAMAQFDAYVDALSGFGIAVTVLDPLEGHPDAHFVEDAAVVTPEIAVVANPGAPARRGEVTSVAAALQPFRRTVWIQPPGTLDGGDVLIVGRHVFIGLSERTNRDGARQLGGILAEHGYTWTPVPVASGLHFKSSVNAVGTDVLAVTPEFAENTALAGFHRIVLPENEVYAANTLLINGHLIMPAGFPETRQKYAALQMPVIELDTSEFRKMDGGLTCLSLRF
ncbi:MAG TPA: N(G),N(G)-dimethylarginine dimethylaminohydrolase [Desulfosarcina sp.]|nr:N(G),N(G)-dimethylarginine dimethylaminohydrolase [Desulfosarcina sp.]